MRGIARLRFPVTTAAAALSVIVLAAAVIGHINLIELPVGIVGRIEQSEIDDIVTMLALVVAAFVIDQTIDSRRSRREAMLDAERVRVVQVTMRTVHDIVNNCLNQMQLLRLDAEGVVPEESLTLFDQAIQETSAKLRTLGDLQVYTETQRAIGTSLDADGTSNRVREANTNDIGGVR